MLEPSEMAKKIAATDPIGIKLDNAVKSLFTYKPLLVRVIKETVSECKDMSYEEIEACIEGEVQKDTVIVNPGITNSGERIQGLDKELYLNEEGLVRLDIFTYLRIPGKEQDDLIKIYLNMEFMNEDKPGYDVCLRGLFYCCRMISMQEGVEFTVHTDDPVKYGNIKKVYSIWICTESAQKRANTIEKYDINRTFLLGRNDDSPRYDIMNVVIIYLSEKHDIGDTENGLIKMLTDFFNERLSGPEKVKRLSEDHGIPMTREIGKEVPEVCTYAEALVLRGIKQGIDQEIINTEKEKNRADAETQRANAESQRADAAEARIRELEAQLAETRRKNEENI